MALIDIDRFLPGFDDMELKFDAVQVMDDSRRRSSEFDTVGMDLESVEAIWARAVLQVPGDFDHDGDRDAVDIDLLSAEIRVRRGGPMFDLNGDSLVNREDLRVRPTAA